MPRTSPTVSASCSIACTCSGSLRARPRGRLEEPVDELRADPLRNRGRHRAAHAEPARPAQQLHRRRCTPRCATRSRGSRPTATARVLVLTGAGRGFCAGQDLSDRAVAPGAAPVDLGASIEDNYRPLVLALARPAVAGRLRGQRRRGRRRREHRARVRHRHRDANRRASSRRSARSASFPIPAARTSCRASSAPRARWASRCSATSCPRRAGGGVGTDLEVRRRRASSRRRPMRLLAQLAQAPTARPRGDQACAARVGWQHARAAARRSSATCSASSATAPTIAKASPRSSRSARRAFDRRAESGPMTTAGALPRDATVAVIGAGAMGAGIAQIAAQAGHPVRLFDTRMGAADDGAQRRSAQTLDGLAAKGKLDAADAAASAARIVAVARARRLRQRAARRRGDRRGSRRQARAVRASSRRSSRRTTILASNTSSLSITALAAGLQHPGRVVGMHFFNPAPLMPLVEVVSGLATDAARRRRPSHATAAAWGKAPVHATSTPGFIVNRCARPFYGEALRLLAERAADAATIDAVLREARRLSDGAVRADGPDRPRRQLRGDAKRVGGVLSRPALSRRRCCSRSASPPDFFGRKSGRGFYDYAADAQPPRAGDTSMRKRLPGAVVVHGDPGVARAARRRALPAPASTWQRRRALDAFPDGAWPSGDAVARAVRRSHGDHARERNRHAEPRALRSRARLFDVRSALAIAAADACAAGAFDAAAGALQAAGIAVSRLDDVAGLAVMRTVAMLANEAADAVTQASHRRPMSTSRCRRASTIRAGRCAGPTTSASPGSATCSHNLAAHYGEDRYRLSPLIARRATRPGMPRGAGTCAMTTPSDPATRPRGRGDGRRRTALAERVAATMFARDRASQALGMRIVERRARASPS